MDILIDSNEKVKIDPFPVKILNLLPIFYIYFGNNHKSPCWNLFTWYHIQINRFSSNYLRWCFISHDFFYEPKNYHIYLETLWLKSYLDQIFRILNFHPNFLWFHHVMVDLITLQDFYHLAIIFPQLSFKNFHTIYILPLINHSI